MVRRRPSCAGVGIMLGPTADVILLGVDLDSCRNPATEEIDAWALEVIGRVDSYGEVSPSEEGVKLFLCVATSDKAALDALFDGQHGRQFRRGNGVHCPAIEVYRSGRYFTTTGDSISSCEELRLVSLDDLRWLIGEAGPRFAGKAKGNGANGAGKDESRSAKAFRKGAALKAAGASYAEMRDALLADADPDIAEWARTKGTANGERELRRIYDNAQAAPGVINPRAPYDVARLFQGSLSTPLHHHRGAFYEWGGAAWPETAEPALRARLYAYLDRCKRKNSEGELCPVKPNLPMVGAVLDALRATAHLDEAVSPPAWLGDGSGPPAHEIVACTNGLLHLPTRRLLPHTPQFFTLNALDFAYEPTAPEPRQWLAFLRQLWPSDGQSIAALQELFGYCLTADTRQQKAFLLVGPKRSGKGTIARVLQRLIGPHNCVAPTLAGLGTNFGLAPLIGKQVAIISDARLSGRADHSVIAERLLSITGEDGVTVDRKYSFSWTGQLQVRFLVISNELPRLADASGALVSRFVLLLLTESFYGREDHDLTTKLLGELPGHP